MKTNHTRLYRSMMKNRQDREREAKRLENKRKFLDKELKGANSKKKNTAS